MKKTIAAFVILASSSVAANEQPSLASLAALLAAEEAAVAANTVSNLYGQDKQEPSFSVPIESVGKAAANTASRAGEIVGKGFVFGRSVVGNMFSGIGQFASEVGAAIKP